MSSPRVILKVCFLSKANSDSSIGIHLVLELGLQLEFLELLGNLDWQTIKQKDKINEINEINEIKFDE
jgi:hypothetical protein